MIDKSVPGDHATRYYPIIDIDDTGLIFIATPNTESNIFHLRNGDAIRAEISCPRCGKRMEHYIDYNKQAVYLCSHCL